MSRAVANTLLPAARPASTIARPRPRELPVTNHTCAIHPPLSSHPPDILEKLLKLRIGCAMGIRKDLLVTEEIAESSDLRADPLSSRVSDCLATPLALSSSWSAKLAARRIVKDKGSGLIKPIETHRKRTDQCKELEGLLVRRNSDRPACVATRQRPVSSHFRPKLATRFNGCRFVEPDSQRRSSTEPVCGLVTTNPIHWFAIRCGDSVLNLY